MPLHYQSERRMKNDLNNAAQPLNQTEVRFSIRSLLVLMTVLAVIVSALGAFIRRFPPEARLRLSLYWAGLAALMLAMFIYTARKRYLAESQAGRVMFRLIPHSYMFPRAPSWSYFLMGVGCLAFAPTIWIFYSFWVGDVSTPAWQSVTNINVVYALMAAAAGFSYLWWRRIIVAENGLIIRNIFVPWCECRSWYWDACNRKVAVVRTNIQAMTAMKVPDEERDAITSLLTNNCGSKSDVPFCHRARANEQKKPPAEPRAD
jgi:hypothetical protein